jgi:glycosyltransferase involved in cell wall biosynthesis
MKITVVIPTRNDNFGGNLIETASYTLNTMSNTFDEVILVDFGSDEPIYPVLAPLITNKRGNIRIITTPKLGEEQTFSDILARNVGIRRATNDIILSSNVDIIPALPEDFDFSQFDENVFYSSGKYMLEHSLITSLRSQGKSWEEIQKYLFQTRESYPRQGLFNDDPWSKVSGCGDFQLGHRKIWFDDRVRGFEETLRFKDYTDTNLHKKIIANAGYEVRVAMYFHVFHQSHIDIRGTAKANDGQKAVHAFLQTSNPDTWGFSDMIFKEYVL